MTLREALAQGRRSLAADSIDDAVLEAELLLRHVLGIDRARLLAHLSDELDPAQEAGYQRLLARRLAREPTAYITGQREFYGLEFEVTPAALIPRPETELLVEEALRVVAAATGERAYRTVADVGTGSGAVAVALAVHAPQARLVATDASRDALRLAHRNACRHGVAGRIALVQTDLLAGLRPPFDIIVANLPYIPTAVWETLPEEIRDHEPRAALDGGPDGLSAVRRFLCAARHSLTSGGALLLEIGHDQGSAVLALAGRELPCCRARLVTDLAGLDRLLVIR